VQRNSRRLSPTPIFLFMRSRESRKAAMASSTLQVAVLMNRKPSPLSPRHQESSRSMESWIALIRLYFLAAWTKSWECAFRLHWKRAGFVVRTHDDPNLQGVDKNNICNRGRNGQGV